MPSIVDQVVSSVELGLFHANMMRQFEALNPQASIDAALRVQLPGDFQSWFYPGNNNTVAAYFGGNQHRKILYLDGIRLTQQGNNLMDGYASALGLQVLQGMNTWIARNMDNYLGFISPPHAQASEFLDLVGYSAGGAVAECMAVRLRQLNDVRKKKVITFGAPRPGGPQVRDALVRFPIARWMTPADPIPLLPPRLQDAPQLATVVPVSLMIAWGNCVHPQGGMVVFADGTVEAAVDPPDALVNPATSLASWLFALTSVENNDHRIERYAHNLLMANAEYDLPREKNRGVGGGEDFDDIKSRDVNRQRDRVVQKIALQQREQGAVIVNYPSVVLFRPIRMGRVWAVGFGDRIVCQGVREDTCRHLCRAGNDFLRSLPKQGVVDAFALLAQMEAFLAFATAEESDWQPKLRTKLIV